MRKLLYYLIGAAIAGIVVAWWLTAPRYVDDAKFADLIGDANAGASVFAAGGCASCHSAPGTEGEEMLVLAGGKAFPSPFGTFYAPNISPSKMNSWSVLELANAMIKGTSPEGAHYFPAFPYTSYRNTAPQDVADLLAYIQSLEPDETTDRPHDVPFPFNIRRSLGGWKLLFVTESYAVDLGGEVTERGRYLVEVLGHCAECHTPRNALGGLKRGQWLAGAAHPSGQGRIPSLRPNDLGWSAFDIAAYLETGFTPEFDSAGGEMAEVIENMQQLPASDREAIAAYLTALE